VAPWQREKRSKYEVSEVSVFAKEKQGLPGNPSSGEWLDIPAKKVPFFKAGNDLRKTVDEQYREFRHLRINSLSCGYLGTFAHTQITESPRPSIDIRFLVVKCLNLR
jgi:hypothetical protein